MKMSEYEYLFSLALHEKLKEKIKGKIYVEVNSNDEICVTISNELYPNGYRMVRSDFSNRLIHGLTADYEAYKFGKIFKTNVMKKLFK